MWKSNQQENNIENGGKSEYTSCNCRHDIEYWMWKITKRIRKLYGKLYGKLVENFET